MYVRDMTHVTLSHSINVDIYDAGMCDARVYDGAICDGDICDDDICDGAGELLRLMRHHQVHVVCIEET